MISVQRIGHATYETPDLARQIDYYTQVIGFRLAERGKDQGKDQGNAKLDCIKVDMTVKYIKPEILKNPAIFPDKAVGAKLEQLQDLTGPQRRLRNKLWTEIKAGR